MSPSDPQTAAETGAIRGGQWTFFACIGVIFAGIVPSLLFLQITVEGGPKNGVRQSANVRLIVAAIFVVGLLIAWRLIRVRLVVGTDGLTAVNPFSTRRAAWSTIQGVRITSRRIRNGQVTRVEVLTEHPFRIAAAMTLWTKRETQLAALLQGCVDHGVRVDELGPATRRPWTG